MQLTELILNKIDLYFYKFLVVQQARALVPDTYCSQLKLKLINSCAKPVRKPERVDDEVTGESRKKNSVPIFLTYQYLSLFNYKFAHSEYSHE